MEHQLEKIQKETLSYRQDIVNHDLYKNIQTIDDLRIFMEHHVYAVWDFMSLLKALQIELTCTEVPWYPKRSGELRYLINEIVIGEESDEGFDGSRTSHFEMYLSAMRRAGASTASIDRFIEQLLAGKDVSNALEINGVEPGIVSFVEFTLKIANSNQAHIIAAAFTFGREDLIPDMFMSIIRDMSKEFPDEMAEFKYYLERHIELDGDHHGQMALNMTAELCGDDHDKWQQAREAIIQCLIKRKQLWDEANGIILGRKKRKA